MYKTYTAEVVRDEGIVCGSRAVRVWFFIGALSAYSKLNDMGHNPIVNFRRVV